MKTTLLSLLMVAATALTTSTLQADPVTYRFTATKTYDWGSTPGPDTIEGTVTLDPGATPTWFLDYDADPYYSYYYSGQQGQWQNGNFSIDITGMDSFGTSSGVGETYYGNWDYYYYYGYSYDGDQIVWYGNGYDGIHRQVYLWSEAYAYGTAAGDLLAAVRSPWAPLTTSNHDLSLYEYDYNTGASMQAQYQITSFEGGAPPDTEPPTFSSLTPTTTTLWPPNHQMVPVTLSASTSDNVGVTSTKIVSVTSSEPDNGLGDGDTAGDFEITGDLTVSLRAERSGKGNGRTYTITVEAVDAAGNTTQKTTTVSVPKSQKK